MGASFLADPSRLELVRTIKLSYSSWVQRRLSAPPQAAVAQLHDKVQQVFGIDPSAPGPCPEDPMAVMTLICLAPNLSTLALARLLARCPNLCRFEYRFRRPLSHADPPRAQVAPAQVIECLAPCLAGLRSLCVGRRIPSAGGPAPIEALEGFVGLRTVVVEDAALRPCEEGQRLVRLVGPCRELERLCVTGLGEGISEEELGCFVRGGGRGWVVVSFDSCPFVFFFFFSFFLLLDNS